MRLFRSRKKLRNDPDEEGDPLGALRRRCKAGAFVGSSTYLAVLASTVVRPTALTLKQIIGLEFGLGIMAVGCAVVSTTVWILTQNMEYALRIWGTAVRSQKLGVPSLPAEPTIPEPRDGDPIPIGYAREVRAQRNRRAI